MRSRVSRPNPPASSELHPAVYAAMLGAALWFVVAAWLSFAAEGYADYLLAVVTVFFLIASGIPVLLWRVRRGQQQQGARAGSFFEWASREFETRQSRLKAGHAAVQVLLPLAAVALGMTALGIVLHLTPHVVR